MDANLRYTRIVEVVNNVCRDLEARCNEVERPLHEKQAKIRDFECENTNLRAQLGTLEEKMSKISAAHHEAEIEKKEVLDQLKSADRKIHKLSEELNAKTEDFQRLKVNAQHASEAAAQSSRERDLAYMVSGFANYQFKIIHLHSMCYSRPP